MEIFIVDDDRDFAESLADVFELRGHRVELAFSGEEAIRIFEKRDFDITFMDVKLPGKNGVESFLEIRKMKPGARLVMMTGYSVEQLLDQAVKNGAWGVLHKPLSLDHVLGMLQNIEPHGILIADDDRDFAESIKDVLKNRGYTVYVAHHGKEAIERIRSGGIDVLVLDLRMPVLNGLEAYLELQKTGQAVPTIIITAYAMEESAVLDTLQSLSITGILMKPFDPKRLLQSVEQLTGGSRKKGATGG